MIDWTTAVVPCRHSRVIDGGSVVSTDEDGCVQYAVAKRRSIVGSAESAVTLRTHRGDLGYLEVSGNLVKFFQGHNLWGTADLVGLVGEFMGALCSTHGPALGLCPTEFDQVQWWSGGFALSRVDVTESFRLPRRADVLAWIRAAEHSAHMSKRGRGELVKGSTLVFGKQSRREALKLYSKGQEVDAHPQHQPGIDPSTAEGQSMLQWADGVLRAELVLRSMSLKRRDMSRGAAWGCSTGIYFDPSAILRETLSTLTMTTISKVDPEVFVSLRPSERVAVVAWESGSDLRGILSKSVFYRLRAKLLKHGVDIATVQPTEKSNVVPLVRVLEAVPAAVPQWAHGTRMYFEPRRRA